MNNGEFQVLAWTTGIAHNHLVHLTNRQKHSGLQVTKSLAIMSDTLFQSLESVEDEASFLLFVKQLHSGLCCVKHGIPLVGATTQLSARGFSCYEGTSYQPNVKGIYECTRNRGRLLYSCIHRVWFEAQSTKGVISNRTVHEPVCADL